MIRFLIIGLLFGFFYLIIFRKKEEEVIYEEAEITQPQQQERRQERIIPRGSVNIAEDGRAVYVYYDTHEHDTIMHDLMDRGLQGGGPTWEGLITAAVQIFHPSIEPYLDFDAEGDGLMIWSSERGPLDRVASLVGRIKADPHFLDACIKYGEEQGYLE